MSNQLPDLLRNWSEGRESARWVLGTVYETVRSSYRKAGAMMLFNDLGQQFGMLSGGCLDSELHRRARQVMDAGRSLCLSFDSADEDDLSYQFGLGCGGVVRILLQPILAENRELDLPRLLDALEHGHHGMYRQLVSGSGAVAAEYTPADGSRAAGRTPAGMRARLVEREGTRWLETPVGPAPHLLLVGGGPDALPLVHIARRLGWTVTVQDDRPAYARQEMFTAAHRITRLSLAEAICQDWFASVTAVVVMSHHLERDAAALQALSAQPLQYLALIGPQSRAAEVLQRAGLCESDLAVPLHAPAGVDVGGELPESVALSILAECHAVLFGGTLSRHSDPDRSMRPIHPLTG